MDEADTIPVWYVLVDDGNGGLEKRDLILSLVAQYQENEG